MSEPVLDMSEIIELYKQDARLSVSRMKAAATCWDEVIHGGEACLQIRKLAHQLRGSGRTYGFRNVTRLGKALEHIMMKLQAKHLKLDNHLQTVVNRYIDRLGEIFK
jgi:chemotaxis protein histidine kinase CheA